MMDKPTRSTLKKILFSAATLITSSTAVSAQSSDPGPLAEVCQAIYIITGFLASVMFAIQGLRWVMSDTPQDRMEAKKGIMYIIIGLLVVYMAATMVSVIYCETLKNYDPNCPGSSCSVDCSISAISGCAVDVTTVSGGGTGTCSDTDMIMGLGGGGLITNNPVTAGTCTDQTGNPSQTDSCSGTTLTEWFCQAEVCTSTTVDCTTGGYSSCAVDRCVPSGPGPGTCGSGNCPACATQAECDAQGIFCKWSGSCIATCCNGGIGFLDCSGCTIVADCIEATKCGTQCEWPLASCVPQ